MGFGPDQQPSSCQRHAHGTSRRLISRRPHAAQAAVGVVDRCIEQIHAHKTGTSRDSLHAVGDITKVLAEEDRTVQRFSALSGRQGSIEKPNL